MTDPFEHDDAEWVEICDADGKRSSMRLLATIGFSGKNYYVLGAEREGEDGEIQHGILLLREDQTVDGVQEYVIADDESEIENVVGRFVMHLIVLEETVVSVGCKTEHNLSESTNLSHCYEPP